MMKLLRTGILFTRSILVLVYIAVAGLVKPFKGLWQDCRRRVDGEKAAEAYEELKEELDEVRGERINEDIKVSWRNKMMYCSCDGLFSEENACVLHDDPADVFDITEHEVFTHEVTDNED